MLCRVPVLNMPGEREFMKMVYVSMDRFFKKLNTWYFWLGFIVSKFAGNVHHSILMQDTTVTKR